MIRELHNRHQKSSLKQSISLPNIANRSSCIIKKARRPPIQTWGSTTIEHVLDKVSTQVSRKNSLSTSRMQKAKKIGSSNNCDESRFRHEGLVNGLRLLMKSNREGKQSRFRSGKENSILETTVCPDEGLGASRDKPSVFDSNFHRQHFKNHLDKQIEEIQLRLPRKVPQKGFLVPIWQQGHHQRNECGRLVKKKYTRMDVSEHKVEDSSIPSFLMELLPPSRWSRPTSFIGDASLVE